MEIPFIPVWTRLRKTKKTSVETWMTQAEQWLSVNSTTDEETAQPTKDSTTGPAPKVVGETCSGPLAISVLCGNEQQPLDSPTIKNKRNNELVLAPTGQNQSQSSKDKVPSLQQPIGKGQIELILQNQPTILIERLV